MKKYIRCADDTYTLLSIDKVSSIIYVEDPEDMERFDTHSLLSTDYVQSATQNTPNYTMWTREQLLELKKEHPYEFNNIQDDYVLLKILKHEDLTPDQLIYLNNRKTVSRDVTIAEVKHILKLIYTCKKITTLPAPKNVGFEDELLKLGIALDPADIDSIVRNLHIRDFSEGRYSTDERYLGSSLLIFNFDPTGFTFACGKSLPAGKLPFGIYIKVDENLVTKKSVILVSFHKADYEMPRKFKNYPMEKTK